MEADVAATSIEMFFLLAVALWCASPDAAIGRPSTPSMALSADEWQNRSIVKAAESSYKGEALTNLCRAVRPLAPQPPQSKRIGGKIEITRWEGTDRKSIR